ncbi:AsmA family protein [Shumkonia mesophila]|uniref:hypothetical protein n=1 Tax=Shumkonia mesophila TaxID=2838854 RepID=UPI002934A960|nr:hypothetical protein [Shumkonia mesophila]
MKKGLLIGGGVVVVVIAVAVFYLWSNLGSVIKAAVEKYGSEITQAKVTLNAVDLSASSGEGSLKGLTVGNPAGFATDSAFRLGAVSLKVDTGSITGDPIVINEVVIQAPEVTYEWATGGSNLDVIKRNIDAFTQKMGAGKSASSDDGAGKKVIIENLYVRDGRVDVAAQFLQGKKMGTPLPTIHLKDIGKEKKGASASEVADKVMSAIIASAGKAVSSLNLDDLAKKAGAQLDAVKGQAGDIMKKATEGAGGTGDTLKEGAAGAGDAIKGLLGGKK